MVSANVSNTENIAFSTVFGTILFSSLNLICLFLRLLFSFIASFMLSVIVSAYNTTLPLTFLAALPIICISDLVSLRNPSLSASNIATKLTSGKSNPSLNKLIPIKISISPILNSFRISTLSNVSISECMYLALYPAFTK